MDEFRSVVSEQSRQLTANVVRGGADNKKLSGLYDSILVLLRGSLAAMNRVRPSAPDFSCRAGCDYCCYLLVSVTPPEVLLIADYIRTNYNLSKREMLEVHIAATDNETRGLDHLGRLLTRKACPFLEGGGCSIYEVRPLTCRGYSSYRWTACSALWRRYRSWKRMPIDYLKQSAYGAAQDGIIQGYRDAGLKGKALELIGGVRTALAVPDAKERWLAGEDVFAAAAETPMLGEEVS